MKCKALLVFLILLLFNACSGIKLISSSKKQSELYSEKFLSKIEKIKDKYKAGKSDEALKELQALKVDEGTSLENGLKHNLIGVIYFSQGKYKNALSSFEEALKTAEEDDALLAQVHLNLASTFFKMGEMANSLTFLKNVDTIQLTEGEMSKFYQLSYIVGSDQSEHEFALRALVKLVGKKDNLALLQQDPYMEKMVSQFFKLSHAERNSFLEGMENEKLLSLGYLGLLEAEKFVHEADNDQADDVLEWVEDNFAEWPELVKLTSGLKGRLDNLAKLDVRAIGVVLPFSGSKSIFAQRAMLGIDSALLKLRKGRLDISVAPIIYTKDSHGSGTVGATAVRNLIENHHVSVIIGGLFSSEATKEYLEAKKHGVLFLSLSQVYLPKEEKDYLLIEIPGSVESQISTLYSNEMLDKFGKKAAILYPNSDRGQAYLNEFWRVAQQRGIEVTGVQSYEEGGKDFRDPVKNILGLSYKRERQEELELLGKIYALEKKGSTRRLQTLTPKVDFDWIFMPAFPQEAAQLIPSFHYFDAFFVNFIGEPSWRSRSLAEKADKFRTVHFIGDDLTGNKQEEFTKTFIEEYRRRPKLIELLSYDSMKLYLDLLASHSFESRDDFNSKLGSLKHLEGITGNWKLEDGVWLKNMVPLHLRDGKVSKVFGGEEAGI